MSTQPNIIQSLSKNPRLIFGLLGALLVAGAGAAVANNKKEEKSSRARDQLFLAKTALDQETAVLVAAEKPKDAPKADAKAANAKDAKKPEPKAPSVEYKALDVDAKFPKSVQAYRAVITQFNGTRAAFEARLALGDLYYKHRQVDKALPWFEAASKDAPSRMEETLALYSLGYSQENLTKFDDAIRSYDQALKMGELGEGLKGDLLNSLARVYELKKDPAKAKAIYDQIIKELPESEYAKSAESLKAAL